jgi:ABC-type Fe3+ transport system substrate-binding protein
MKCALTRFDAPCYRAEAIDAGELFDWSWKQETNKMSHAICVLYLVIAVLLPHPLLAQPRKPATIVEIATYNGTDRAEMLYAGAKVEGKVTWYTWLAGDSYKAIARAFETKYPGVRLDAYRAGGTELIPRMSEEAKARRPVADALETTEDSLLFAETDLLIRPYAPPLAAKYPGSAKDTAERGAPIAWVPMELVPTNTDGVALASQPPHPFGAMLLVDFLLGEAVKILEKFQYGHPSVDYEFKRWYQDQGRTVEQLEKDAAKWEKLAKEFTQR